MFSCVLIHAPSKADPQPKVLERSFPDNRVSKTQLRQEKRTNAEKRIGHDCAQVPEMGLGNAVFPPVPMGMMAIDGSGLSWRS